MKRKSARLVLASIAYSLSLKSRLLHLEANGCGSTGRTRKTRCVWLSPASGKTILIAHELSVRRGDLPSGVNDLWTTFGMELREPASIPPALDFTRFLVSSITFMAHLREVSVYFDDKRLVHLTKDAGAPDQISIPQGLKPTSVMGFMNVKGLKSTCKWLAHHLPYSA